MDKDTSSWNKSTVSTRFASWGSRFDYRKRTTTSHVHGSPLLFETNSGRACHNSSDLLLLKQNIS